MIYIAQITYVNFWNAFPFQIQSNPDNGTLDNMTPQLYDVFPVDQTF